MVALIPRSTLRALPCLVWLAACADTPAGDGNANQDPAADGGAYVPGSEWETADPADVGLDAAAVEAFVDDVFTNPVTQGVVVVRNGYLVAERYADGADRTSPATSWSLAKSFYAEALGVAVDEGFVASIDDPASDYLTEWQGTDKEAISLRTVLEMRTGLENDVYGLFFSGDFSGYSVGLPLLEEADSVFDYNNANSELVGEVIRRATGEASGDYLQDRVLDPLGIDPISLWVDEAGDHVNFAGIDATTRDFARFGLLMARGGTWGSEAVLPAAYVEESLAPGSDLFYGLHWWTYNQAYLDLASVWLRDGEPPPTAPDHSFSMAWGADGQYIFPWPEEDLVIVINTFYGYDEDSPNPVLSAANFPVTNDEGDAFIFTLADHLRLAEQMVVEAD